MLLASEMPSVFLAYKGGIWCVFSTERALYHVFIIAASIGHFCCIFFETRRHHDK